jgi:hemolysin activation/secretion protein
MILLKRTSHLQLLLFCSLGSSFAQAQQTIIPSSADPVKAAERFQDNPFGNDNADPLSFEKKESDSAPGESGRFVLGGVKIQGMTTYKPEQFTSVYQAMLGKSIGKEDVDQIAASIGQH